tara:strand:- start:473 stop:982 length:510 start_codon:yes stop_codon:yes gene_type:complete
MADLHEGEDQRPHSAWIKYMRQWVGKLTPERMAEMTATERFSVEWYLICEKYTTDAEPWEEADADVRQDVTPDIQHLFAKDFHDLTKVEREAILEWAKKGEDEAAEWNIPVVGCYGCGHTGEHAELRLVAVTDDIPRPDKPFGAPAEMKYVCEHCLDSYDAACREAGRQ